MRTDLPKLVSVLRFERGKKERRRRRARDRAVISMPSWRALRAKGDNDVGQVSPHKIADLSDQSVGINLAQHSIAVAGRRQ